MKNIVLLVFLVSCTRAPVNTTAHWDRAETINNLEDVREWMISDMEQGYLDSTRTQTYIRVIDESIVNLNK